MKYRQFILHGITPHVSINIEGLPISNNLDCKRPLLEWKKAITKSHAMDAKTSNDRTKYKLYSSVYMNNEGRTSPTRRCLGRHTGYRHQNRSCRAWSMLESDVEGDSWEVRYVLIGFLMGAIFGILSYCVISFSAFFRLRGQQQNSFIIGSHLGVMIHILMYVVFAFAAYSLLSMASQDNF